MEPGPPPFGGCGRDTTAPASLGPSSPRSATEITTWVRTARRRPSRCAPCSSSHTCTPSSAPSPACGAASSRAHSASTQVGHVGGASAQVGHVGGSELAAGVGRSIRPGGTCPGGASAQVGHGGGKRPPRCDTSVWRGERPPRWDMSRRAGCLGWTEGARPASVAKTTAGAGWAPAERARWEKQK